MSLRDRWEEQANAWIDWARAPGHDSYWRHHRDQFLGIRACSRRSDRRSRMRRRPPDAPSQIPRPSGHRDRCRAVAGGRCAGRRSVNVHSACGCSVASVGRRLRRSRDRLHVASRHRRDARGRRRSRAHHEARRLLLRRNRSSHEFGRKIRRQCSQRALHHQGRLSQGLCICRRGRAPGTSHDVPQPSSLPRGLFLQFGSRGFVVEALREPEIPDHAVVSEGSRRWQRYRCSCTGGRRAWSA